MNLKVLKVSKRENFGSSSSRKLRRSGFVPGIIYGGGQAPQAIELDHNKIYNELRKRAFHSSILEIEVDGVLEKVLLRDFSLHPFKPIIFHVDFFRVDDTHKVTMKVPLRFVGEDLSSAVKIDACVVNHVLNEIEVSCLPALIPSVIEVDLSKMVKNSALTTDDLILPAGVTLVMHGREAQTVVSAFVKTEEAVAPASTPVAS